MPVSTVSKSMWRRHGQAAGDHVAETAAPTTVAHGIACEVGEQGEKVALDIQHTAAGARIFTIVIWGFKHEVNFKLGSAVAPIVGAPAWTNVGQIAVTGSANGGECHQLEGLSRFSRVAAQIINATGAPTVYCDFGFGPGTRKG